MSRPSGIDDEERAAKQILSALLRRAYRRPVTDADLAGPLALYRNARAEDDFDAGIEMAVAAVLVSPHFLFRVESDPAGLPPGTPYRVSDLELASRLSFFLWSSIPDDELLADAEQRRLHEPAVLERQVRRMLADRRSDSLVNNFAAQWLHLRNLDSITPDMRLFPDFDDNLRQAFRQETELFFESVLREDRSVLDLLRSNYTFVNERLAKHYGIPHVYGSRFRRITLDEDSERGGLLRQGSILTVTSYATRTSPVVRGKWVLDNLIGVPPPPPLPDVPALKDNTVDGNLTVRKRLAEHRSNAVCAGVPQPDGSDGAVAREVRRRRATAQRGERRGDRRRRAVFPMAAASPMCRGSKRRCCAGRNCSSAPWPRSCSPMRRAVASSTTMHRRFERSCATRARRTSACHPSSLVSSRASHSR